MSRLHSYLRSYTALLAMIGFASSSQVNPITLNAEYRGWYNRFGSRNLLIAFCISVGTQFVWAESLDQFKTCNPYNAYWGLTCSSAKAGATSTIQYPKYPTEYIVATIPGSTSFGETASVADELSYTGVKYCIDGVCGPPVLYTLTEASASSILELGKISASSRSQTFEQILPFQDEHGDTQFSDAFSTAHSIATTALALPLVLHGPNGRATITIGGHLDGIFVGEAAIRDRTQIGGNLMQFETSLNFAGQSQSSFSIRTDSGGGLYPGGYFHTSSSEDHGIQQDNTYSLFLDGIDFHWTMVATVPTDTALLLTEYLLVNSYASSRVDGIPRNYVENATFFGNTAAIDYFEVPADYTLSTITDDMLVRVDDGTYRFRASLAPPAATVPEPPIFVLAIIALLAVRFVGSRSC